MSISGSRPNMIAGASAARARKRSGSRTSSRSRHRRNVSGQPFRLTSPIASMIARRPSSRRSESLRTTVPGAATSSSRAARFGAAPAPSRPRALPRPVTSLNMVSPAAMPIRIASGLDTPSTGRSGSAASASSAARAACTASSSLARGKPK